MSVKHNQDFVFWKDVQARLRRTETAWRGKSLSGRDHKAYTDSILMCAMVLHDLSNRYTGLGSRRHHVSWAIKMAQVDVADLADFLSDAIVAFRLSVIASGGLADPRHQNNDSVSSPLKEANASVIDDKTYRMVASTTLADFKHQLAKKYPFSGDFFGPMKGRMVEHFDHPSQLTFHPIYQVLSFITHLTLRDIDMSQELEDGFLEDEERLTNLCLPDWFVDEMNFVMKRWLRDFEIGSDFCPKHGPGATAELDGRGTTAEKYGLLAPPFNISRLFRMIDIDVADFLPLPALEPTSRTSKVVFVPKSMKKKRVIAKETTTHQYFEQGVASSINYDVRHHEYLSRRINLSDQTLQRDAALDASRTLEFATVDLTAASDSVPLDLVKRVFKGTVYYLFLGVLRCTSTELPSGKEVHLVKFASMGSALAFPIETLIFACILECTARYMDAVEGIRDFRYRVYGDDIIVPETHYESLRLNLVRCGFRINEAKTYHGRSLFRESCGCDALAGHDVTVMKIGRRFTSDPLSSRSPGLFEGLIDMANAAHTYQFPTLRGFLIRKLIDSPWKPAFSNETDCGLYSSEPTNFHLAKRWSVDLQRWEYKAASPHTYTSYLCPIVKGFGRDAKFVEGDASRMAEDARYFEWMRLTRDRRRVFVDGTWSGDLHDPDSLPDVHVGGSVETLRNTWVWLPS